MFFEEITEAPPDPVFGLNEAFQADPRPNKVNLIVGIYKDESLRADVMHSVVKAKNLILNQELIADYLLIDGLAEYYEQIGMLAFGESCFEESRGRIYAAQCIGGTGALQVAGQFLYQEVTKTIAIPKQTWVNHKSIFERAGFKVATYPYYNAKTHEVDFEALLTSIGEMEAKTVVLLHPVCQNPTGVDLSLEQWKELSLLMKKKKLLPLFDFAYQGFGEGIEKDREAIEVFMDDGHEMLVAYSCSKNCSLYCQRVGALFVVGQNLSAKKRIGSQIKKIIRSLYSNPPAHGARIVAALLKDRELKEEWKKELNFMRERIKGIKEMLVHKLSKETKGPHFEFLLKGKGMFSLLDLDKTETRKLIDQFGVYLADGGRISLSAINAANLDYVASSIASVRGL